MSASTTSDIGEIAIDAPTLTIDITGPYRWVPEGIEGSTSSPDSDGNTDQEWTCDECSGRLASSDFETYCVDCGLIHERRIFWHMSLSIEAKRRQFDHDSEDGNGTLQNLHATAFEDSAADTTFDGSQLDYWVYPLDQYNEGRDGHRGRQDDKQKLDRDRRFLEQRAEACATAAGLTGEHVRQIIRYVTSINSGAFTSYGPEREGGGQDAHIVAAIAYVGNQDITDIDHRMEHRDEFTSVVTDIGMDRDDVRGAVSQLRKQLNGERR